MDLPTVNRRMFCLFQTTFFKTFHSFFHHFLVTSYLLVVVRLFMDWIQVKSQKSWKQKKSLIPSTIGEHLKVVTKIFLYAQEK